MNDALKAIASELGIAEDGTDEQVLEAVKAQKAAIAEAIAARGTTSIPAAALTIVGVPEHADEQTFLTAVRAKDETITELQAKITGLQTQADQAVALAKRVADLEREGRDRDIDQILRDEVRAFRVLPSEVEQLSTQFADNVDGLKTLVNARPAGLFEHLARPRGSGADTRRDAEVRAIGEQFGASDKIPVDEDSARLHVAAMDILREQGKEYQYTEAEYAAALTAASKQPALA